MIPFKNFLVEEEQKESGHKTLHAFDMDEVLFHHDHSKLKIHVKDKKGKVIRVEEEHFDSLSRA